MKIRPINLEIRNISYHIDIYDLEDKVYDVIFFYDASYFSGNTSTIERTVFVIDEEQCIAELDAQYYIITDDDTSNYVKFVSSIYEFFTTPNALFLLEKSLTYLSEYNFKEFINERTPVWIARYLLSENKSLKNRLERIFNDNSNTISRINGTLDFANIYVGLNRYSDYYTQLTFEIADISILDHYNNNSEGKLNELNISEYEKQILDSVSYFICNKPFVIETGFSYSRSLNEICSLLFLLIDSLLIYGPEKIYRYSTDWDSRLMIQYKNKLYSLNFESGD